MKAGEIIGFERRRKYNRKKYHGPLTAAGIRAIVRPQNHANIAQGTKLSPQGLDALKRREGTCLRYYNDHPKDGNCTWGTGFLAHHGPCTPAELARRVSPARVDAELCRRVLDAQRVVRTMVAVPLTQEQYDALVSFTYNTGFTGAGRVLALVKTNKFSEAAALMKSGYVTGKTKGPDGKIGRTPPLKGLIVRRNEEAAPFEAGARQ